MAGFYREEDLRMIPLKKEELPIIPTRMQRERKSISTCIRTYASFVTMRYSSEHFFFINYVSLRRNSLFAQY